MHENNFEFYLRNMLTSIAIACLSYYNIRYTAALVIQMGDHIAFKHGVRMKIVSIASLIQVCLLLRFFWIWTANFFWFQYPHGARDYLTFEASFFVLSELLPFLIFCVVLTIRIMAYKRDYYEKILRETNVDVTKTTTERGRAHSDVSKSAMVNSLEPDNRASQTPGTAVYEDPYSDNRSRNRRPDGHSPSASRESMVSRTMSEVSDRRMSADFGPNITQRMDLGPLNMYYKEGLKSSMSPLTTIKNRLPGLPAFAKNFFFKPVKDTNDITNTHSFLEGP